MSSFCLKIFACVFMLIDHIGFCLFPNILTFRIIGRLAFPMFAYQTALGYSHTKNKSKYILRMLIFALVSQLPFMFMKNMAGYSSFSTNIGFSLLISLLCLYTIDLFNKKRKKKNYYTLLLIFPLLLIGELLKVDYAYYGPLMVMIFYVFKDLKKNFLPVLILFLLATALFTYTSGSLLIQYFAVLTLFILLFYNGKKGKDIKYWFYTFYPLHMIILGLIKYFIV